MNRQFFTHTIFALVVMLSCAMLLTCVGCKKNPTAPKNNGGSEHNDDNDGGDDNGGYDYAMATAWTAAQECDNLQIYIDSRYVGTLRTIRVEPTCGQQVSGAVTVTLEPGTHEAYFRLGGEQSDTETLEIEAGTCYLYEFSYNSPNSHQWPSMRPRRMSNY